MSYMDGSLTARQQAELERHASSCAPCAEDFAVYRGIMADFSETALISAPEGFDEAVMEKIRALPAISRPREFFDSVVFGIWGVFSVLMGLGVVLALNKDTLLAGMSQNPAYINLMALINPISAYVSDAAGGVAKVWQNAVNAVSAYAGPIKYAVVAAFVLLAAVQFFVHKNDKVEA